MREARDARGRSGPIEHPALDIRDRFDAFNGIQRR
jgi:hypothetical protein